MAGCIWGIPLLCLFLLSITLTLLFSLFSLSLSFFPFFFSSSNSFDLPLTYVHPFFFSISLSFFISLSLFFSQVLLALRFLAFRYPKSFFLSRKSKANRCSISFFPLLNVSLLLLVNHHRYRHHYHYRHILFSFLTYSIVSLFLSLSLSLFLSLSLSLFLSLSLDSSHAFVTRRKAVESPKSEDASPFLERNQG